MTKPVSIRMTRDGDIEAMLPFVRQADVDEIWASAKKSVEYALVEGRRRSDITWTGRVDGEIVCIFGVAPGSILGGIGIPWLLGTEALERHAVGFIRHSRAALWMMLNRYDHLMNFVDERNRVAQRWLAWLGFTIENPEPFGPYQLPFRKFWMTRPGGERYV